MAIPIVATAPTKAERSIVYLVMGVQFVNVVDFMMVNPLGPMLARALGMPTSTLPIVLGAYTAAASVSGVLGSLLLERFGRRSALAVILIGLALGTVAGGLAMSLETLIAARVVAGLFGGPATSLSLAIVSDAVHESRRGWAMGIVMGGFAVASVLGVPAGLWLARAGGWRLPFFAIGALLLVTALLAWRLLPPLRGHLAALHERKTSPLSGLGDILRKRTVLLSLGLTMLTMVSTFMVIPNIPALVLYNLHFPEARLDVLYLLGGLASLVTTRAIGPLVDRFGSTRVSIGASALVASIMWIWFVAETSLVPVLVVSTALFAGMGARGVAYSALTSMVPEPHERARFQSMQSAVQHGASAGAAFLSAQLLSAEPSGRLLHIERIGLSSVVLCAAVPVMMVIVARAVRLRARA